jgi:hypothetical protein
VKGLEGNQTEAFDTLRRALSHAEEALGPENAETVKIVIIIGILYVKQNSPLQRGGGAAEARPWLERYLAWFERRMGPSHPEVTGTLHLLGMSAMSQRDYMTAEKYYERLTAAYGNTVSKEAQNAAQNLQLCQMNTRFLKPRNTGSDITSLLKGFRF